MTLFVIGTVRDQHRSLSARYVMTLFVIGTVRDQHSSLLTQIRIGTVTHPAAVV
jgi:hypothetical protein